MRSFRKPLVLASVVVLVAAACGTSDTNGPAVGGDAATPSACDPSYPEVGGESDPDARPAVADPIDVTASALPPQHLDTTTHPESVIDRELIVTGGPPPDGIPAINDPQYLTIDEVTFLCDNEPVLVLDVDEDVRAYPVQILTWHELVNDVVGDIPVTVSYCPLCNSAIAYDRRVDGRVLDFGTSGSLYQSAMVMYDRQTESLWTHIDATAVVGELIGTELDVLPMATISWADFVAEHPDGEVLSWRTGHSRDYGRNPYLSYDSEAQPRDIFFDGEVDERLPAKERVVGIKDGDAHVAVPLATVAAEGVVAMDDTGRELTVWHKAGTASALDRTSIAGGADVGATGVFVPEVDGQALTFRAEGDGFVDGETGSTWTILGAATSGALAGSQLEPIEHLDTFWFAWSTFRVDTTIFSG